MKLVDLENFITAYHRMRDLQERYRSGNTYLTGQLKAAERIADNALAKIQLEMILPLEKLQLTLEIGEADEH